jgi:hypothetical protein
MGNRVGESAKKILKEFVADVYCYTDLCKGPKGGLYVLCPLVDDGQNLSFFHLLGHRGSV